MAARSFANGARAGNFGINQDLPGSGDRHFLHFALEPMVAGGVDDLAAALPDSQLLGWQIFLLALAFSWRFYG